MAEGDRNELIYLAGRIYLEAPKIAVKRPFSPHDQQRTSLDSNEKEEDNKASRASLQNSSIIPDV